MPFIAEDDETGERLDITRMEAPRNKYSAKGGSRAVCPTCGNLMYVKGGDGRKVRLHWYHHSNDGCPSAGESPEHRRALLFVRDRLEEYYEDHKGNPEIRLEVWFPECGRRADVAELWPSGAAVAHEVQLSSMTPEELEERTQDYLRGAVDVKWYFGEDVLCEDYRKWCAENGIRCAGVRFS